MPLIFMAAAAIALAAAFRVSGSASRAFQVMYALFMSGLAACAAAGEEAIGWASSLPSGYPDDRLRMLLSRSLEFLIHIGVWLSAGATGMITAALGLLLSASVAFDWKFNRQG